MRKKSRFKNMLISLRKTHKEHLQYLTIQPVQIVEDFCKLATEFLHNGPNIDQYTKISQKVKVEAEVIQNCIYGIIHLLLLGCKHKLSEADFRDSVLTLGFSQEQQAILSNLYNSIQDELHQVLKVPISESHFDHLRWRFEVQVSSRTLAPEVVPLITLELTTKTEINSAFEKEKHLLQTDPNNLVHIVNELENALAQSKSRHSRKIEKALKN